MIIKLLKSDLKRQYQFEGRPSKKPSLLGVVLGLFSPRFLPVILCRVSRSLFLIKLSPLAKLVSLFNFVLFGTEISARCELGESLYFPHTVGTVIGGLKIGNNVVIYHGVTLGAKFLDLSYSSDKRPSVGNDVVIGAGAKILGGITIGNNVVIGANSVVTESVPDNVVVAGIPAKVIKEQKEIIYGAN